MMQNRGNESGKVCKCQMLPNVVTRQYTKQGQSIPHLKIKTCNTGVRIFHILCWNENINTK